MKYPCALRTTLSLAAIVGTMAALSSIAMADEIVMRDGTVHTGKVVSRDRRSVTIDTEVHGINTRLKLDRRQVKSIVISDDEPVTTTTPTSTPTNAIP